MEVYIQWCRCLLQLNENNHIIIALAIVLIPKYQTTDDPIRRLSHYWPITDDILVVWENGTSPYLPVILIAWHKYVDSVLKSALTFTSDCGSSWHQIGSPKATFLTIKLMWNNKNSLASFGQLWFWFCGIWARWRRIQSLGGFKIFLRSCN